MIKDGKPCCDECKRELEALTEEEAIGDIIGHGWSDWRTAVKHYCYQCAEKILEQVGWPPCDECRTQPCERGGECWADSRFPVHIFPYETYYAELKEGGA